MSSSGKGGLDSSSSHSSISMWLNGSRKLRDDLEKSRKIYRAKLLKADNYMEAKKEEMLFLKALETAQKHLTIQDVRLKSATNKLEDIKAEYDLLIEEIKNSEEELKKIRSQFQKQRADAGLHNVMSPEDSTQIEFSLEESNASIQSLTPNYLAEVITPYLNAIAQIQRIIDEIVGRPHKVKIHSITQYSPVEVTVTGILKAIEMVEIPKKRAQAIGCQGKPVH